MVRIPYLILIISLLSLTGLAQERVVVKDGETPETEKKGIIYNKEFSIGGKLTSNGWGVFAETGKILNIYRTRLFQFELADIRHPKERKQSAELNILSNSVSSPRDFFFGKQNEFFVLRAGFGYKRNIAEKARKNGVRLSLVYVGGVSIGFNKPYYLELAYFTRDPIDTTRVNLVSRTERYNDDPEEGNADIFLNWRNILGAAPFSKGFGEIEVIPGIYGKFALNFEWGKKESFISALEAGVMADIYYKKVPIMVTEDNKPFFMTAYISFQVGRRK